MTTESVSTSASGDVPATPASGKRILLVGGGREALDLLEDARQLGLKVVNLNARSHFKDTFLPLIEHALITDYRDIAAVTPIVRAMHAAMPFDQVVSLSEAGLVPAAELADALGMATNPLRTVRMLKNKLMMRERLREVGLSPVHARSGKTIDDVVAFIAECDGPVILKPIDGASSFSVLRVEHSAQASAAVAAMQAAGVHDFLMEEYLSGPEISVEAFSFDGRHVVIAVTDKWILDNHVEIGHAVPSGIDTTLRAEVEHLVVRFLDAVGLRNGPSHTEIKLTPAGPRVIESHNRVGGDRINDLVRIAYGVNMKSLALAWQCGAAEALQAPPPLRAGAAIRFFTPPPGTVMAIEHADTVRGLPGFEDLRLSVRVGDTVRPVRSSDERAGQVIASGSDAREAIERCERMRDTLRIVTA